MTKTNKLITENIDVLLKKIAFPAATGLIFNTLYHLIDTIYVSKISTQSLSSLSFCSMLLFFILAINFGLTIATRIQIGYYIGKKKDKLIKIIIGNSLFLALFIAFFLSIILNVFLEEIFLLMGAKDDILYFAIDYMQIIIFSIVPMFLSLNINAILSAHGDTRTYRNIQFIGLFLNIILNPLFIYGFSFIPNFGFSGVAISTLLIHCIIFIYMLIYLYFKQLINISKILKYIPSKKILKSLFQQAYPSSLNMIIMSIGNILLISFISFYDYKAVAGFGIGYRIEQLILLPMLGINVAITVLVSTNYGAKKIDRIEEIFNKSFKYGAFISIFGIIILTTFGHSILLLFDKDVTVIDTAYKYIVYKSFAFMGTSLIFICTAMIQAIRKPKIIPLINFIRQIIVPSIVFYIIIFMLNFDISKIWFSIIVITYSTALYLLIYLKKELKELKKY